MIQRIRGINAIIEGRSHPWSTDKVYAASKEVVSLYDDYERNLIARDEWVETWVDSEKRSDAKKSQSLDKQSARVSSMEKVLDEIKLIELQLKEPDIAPDSAKSLESKLKELDLKFNELHQSIMNEMFDGDEELIENYKSRLQNLQQIPLEI